MAIPLQAFKSTTAFKAIYAANPQSARTTVILVEGPDDKAILERWFDQEIREELVKFKNPEEQAGKANGCEHVIQVVNDCSGAAIPVFGIVDRDAIISHNIDLFMEINDTLFKNSRPFGDRIRVLCRWEIESYLLNPSAILKLLRDIKGERNVSIEVRDILASAIKASEAVLLLTAANLAIRQQKSGAVLKSLWKVKDTCSAEDMLRHLRNESSIWSTVASELATMKEKLEGFAAGLSQGTEEYLHAFLRCLDGKALLSRLFMLLDVEYCPKHLRILARVIGPDGAPEEIRNYINDFLNHARETPPGS